jgi:hypothetical protein
MCGIYFRKAEQMQKLQAHPKSNWQVGLFCSPKHRLLPQDHLGEGGQDSENKSELAAAGKAPGLSPPEQDAPGNCKSTQVKALECFLPVRQTQSGIANFPRVGYNPQVEVQIHQLWIPPRYR